MSLLAEERTEGKKVSIENLLKYHFNIFLSNIATHLVLYVTDLWRLVSYFLFYLYNYIYILYLFSSLHFPAYN